MAKRKRTESKEKKIKDGRGQGHGIDYKPWLKIQDVSSLGRSTRLKGIKVPRQYEFLSDLERNYFYILEFSDYVVDIREQYSLQEVDTVLIAEELGLAHPKHPKTHEPIIMTTDFVVTTEKNGQICHVARTLKYQDDLADKRVLEKFEIERAYWERQGVDWGIVTENEIPKILAKNIGSIHSYYDLSDIEGFHDLEESEITDMCIHMTNLLLRETLSLKEVFHQVEEDFGLGIGMGFSLYRHLLIRKSIQVDLTESINIRKIVPILAVVRDYSNKEDVM
ncbi:TnsA endonuclease N-terminal domain-containing protein [Brevibacillus laterosporus]|uniref:Heteromeric transposase endonuclease subunit TnsA n=1 Tax=Brevibacillus laterosporus TaxID=1465 RepID=A0AAP8QBB8_BRELA|nr:TnsA endonuclease N-terminal domain-containing protein [Brevibacillus laterosporus]MED1662771.1 TnsA endonuclease N-terminal domain-containing protein [Brevibacillus laterosporus]MED1669103.1 TnsA endonuclease N-terminal domain-containing protein [Brevibacillus laterosporus]MED1720578.1 TnsA endonuclease N-terminal domain-containing protein [Brevibacillus laterosporus]PPA88356.1 heteromeric transposase endonuclease subunit TnsA [Brevibacillus laterosporus]PPA93925.1 heteromeric transposase 